ncbi:carrier superfamily protein, partial [Acanthamoeba castellanii str. Neff]
EHSKRSIDTQAVSKHTTFTFSATPEHHLAAPELTMSAEIEMPAVVAAATTSRPVSRAWQDLVSGIASGVSIVVAGHPLDTVRGLFKGMVSPLMGVPPIYAVVFGVYGSTKRLMGETADTPLAINKIALAGAITGLATVAFAAPAEAIKARLQVQYSSAAGSARYSGPVDCAKQMYRAGGIRGVFKGTAITAYRDVPGNAIYFGVYEMVKRCFIPAGGSARDVGPLPMMLAGGLAGTATWLTVYPLDIVKSRVQIDVTGKYAHGHRGLWQAYKEIVAESGSVRGLYRGITPALLRSFPANAACFLGYEMSMRLLHFLSPS